MSEDIMWFNANEQRVLLVRRKRRATFVASRRDPTPLFITGVTALAAMVNHELAPTNRFTYTTQHTALPARMFARLSTAIEATGLGRLSIYRLFPPPVHLGPRAVA